MGTATAVKKNNMGVKIIITLLLGTLYYQAMPINNNWIPEGFFHRETIITGFGETDYKGFHNSETSIIVIPKAEIFTQQRLQEVSAIKQTNAIQKKELESAHRTNLTLATIIILLFILLLIIFYFSLKQKKLYRVVKLRNSQINNKNIELQNTINTRDRLISVIAHDIKNPLGTISGFADLICMNKGGNPKIHKYAEIIAQSSNNLHVLLDNLLEWARSQKENINIFPSQLNVNKEIEQTLKLLHPIALDKNIRIKNRCEIHHNIYADRNSFTTVIRNITSNAIKFSEPNSSIYISTENEGKYIAIHIQDTGIGIKDDDIPKLFNPEFARENIGSHPNKGTGVGLLLCKEFVDLNEGKIKVNSIIGKGSVFTLHFPKSTLNQN